VVTSVLGQRKSSILLLVDIAVLSDDTSRNLNIPSSQACTTLLPLCSRSNPGPTRSLFVVVSLTIFTPFTRQRFNISYRRIPAICIPSFSLDVTWCRLNTIGYYSWTGASIYEYRRPGHTSYYIVQPQGAAIRLAPLECRGPQMIPRGTEFVCVVEPWA
jgi:hypothetical protein